MALLLQAGPALRRGGRPPVFVTVLVAALAVILAGFAPLMAAGTDFPVTVIDGAGLPVTLDRPPEGIASVTLGSDEIVLSLVSPSRVAAVTALAVDPSYSFVVDLARQVPLRIQRANAEQILALRPDIVFVAGYTSADVVKQLEDAGLTVFRFMEFDSIARLAEHVRRMGQLLGARGRAEAIVADVNRRLAAVRERVAGLPRPRVLSYSSFGYAPGAGTSVGDMIERARAVNVAAEAGLVGWQALSKEQVVALDPDFLLVQQGDPFALTVRSDPALQTVKAVREGRVLVVPPRYLVTVSHFIIESVEYLADLFHPRDRG